MPYGNINVDTVTTSTPQGILGAGNASIMKNRIINGAMVIDQRNAGASVTNTAGPDFICDRFMIQSTATSKLTGQQVTTAPVGFNYSTKITSLAATSLAAGDFYIYSQGIEGYNLADLNWGTANAKTVTLSFWVQSSLTGTFGGSLDGVGAGSYPFSYTISSANTWEQKSITIAGPTSGTFGSTNGVGIYVRFGLGVGSTYSGTAGSWSATRYFSATGATSVVGTNGATFYITGVQLEVGSSATGFEYRQYGTELALCQRYYYKANSTGGNQVFGFGYNTATTESAIGVPFLITMRSVPTFTASAANTFLVQDNANRVPTAITMQTASVSYASVLATLSGLTVGGGTKILDNNTSANLAFSSEL